MKRKLTKDEWTGCLEILKRKRLWPYMPGDGFWEGLKSCADVSALMVLEYIINHERLSLM